MKVREVPVGTENKRVFKVPSSSEDGVYHEVQRLNTIAGTIVYKCKCIGYMTRQKQNPFYECRHIRATKDYLEEK